MTKCSVIIVTYNAKRYTQACLAKLVAGLRPADGIEIALFDNDSRDGIGEIVRGYKGKSGFVVALNDRNIGFALGNNEAAKLAHGEYLFLLNPDTEIEASEVRKLIAYLDAHPDVGVVGPKIFDPAGAVQESYGHNMTVVSELVGKIFGSKYMFKLPIVRQIRNRHYNKDAPADVGWIGGAALMIRRNVFDDVGGIDPHFFYSAGDMVDLCASVKERGYRVVLYPLATMVHYGGAATVTDKTESLRKSFEGGLYFFKKHYGRSGYMGAKLVYLLTSFVKGCAAFVIFMVTFKKEYADIFRSHFTNFGRLIVGKL